MSGLRVVTTDILCHLNEVARRNNFNRQLSDVCIDSLDPDGFHVLELVLYGHNMDSAPILHHRAMLHMKFAGRTEPETALLDIPDEVWQTLPAWDDIKDKYRGMLKDALAEHED
jgi:hypothetical protein